MNDHISFGGDHKGAEVEIITAQELIKQEGVEDNDGLLDMIIFDDEKMKYSSEFGIRYFRMTEKATLQQYVIDLNAMLPVAIDSDQLHIPKPVDPNQLQLEY